MSRTSNKKLVPEAMSALDKFKEHIIKKKGIQVKMEDVVQNGQKCPFEKRPKKDTI